MIVNDFEDRGSPTWLAGDWTQGEQILLQVRELAVEYRKWQYSPSDLEQNILAAQSKATPKIP